MEDVRYMAMVLKNNTGATNTLNTLNANEKRLAKSLRKVASGMKIEGAGDDASGYAISERMRVQIRGLDQATANTQNGISLLKVAEGAVGSTVDLLRTMKEKAINAANDTNTDHDRATIQKEWNEMIDQIDDNANMTYNGKYLIDGSHDDAHAATAAVYANNSLDTDATNLPTNGVPLVDLKDRNGNPLGIQSTDRITFSLVSQGKTYVMPAYEIGTTESLAHLMGTRFAADIADAVNPPNPNPGVWDFNSGIAVVDRVRYYGIDGYGNVFGPPDGGRTTIITNPNAATAPANQDPFVPADTGLEYMIAGFTISVTDREGNVKKDVNAVLNDFTLVQRARNASPDNAFTFQVGTKANQSIKVGLTDMRAYALGLKGMDGRTVSLSTQATANAALAVVDNALQMALDQQTTIGAVSSRLAYTADNLRVGSENTQASESTIRDADMAKEMTAYTKANVLTQAAQSMLAQANQSTSSVLSLL